MSVICNRRIPSASHCNEDPLSEDSPANPKWGIGMRFENRKISKKSLSWQQYRAEGEWGNFHVLLTPLILKGEFGDSEHESMGLKVVIYRLTG